MRLERKGGFCARRKQLLGSEPDRAVRVVASITGLSYGWRGEQDVAGQEQTYWSKTAACEVREMCSELSEATVI